MFVWWLPCQHRTDATATTIIRSLVLSAQAGKMNEIAPLVPEEGIGSGHLPVCKRFPFHQSTQLQAYRVKVFSRKRTFQANLSSSGNLKEIRFMFVTSVSQLAWTRAVGRLCITTFLLVVCCLHLRQVFDCRDVHLESKRAGHLGHFRKLECLRSKIWLRKGSQRSKSEDVISFFSSTHGKWMRFAVKESDCLKEKLKVVITIIDFIRSSLLLWLILNCVRKLCWSLAKKFYC